jgi:hypothetical protein
MHPPRALQGTCSTKSEQPRVVRQSHIGTEGYACHGCGGHGLLYDAAQETRHVWCLQCVSSAPVTFSAEYINAARTRRNIHSYAALIDAMNHRKELVEHNAKLREIYEDATAGVHLKPWHLRYAWKTLRRIEQGRQRKKRVYSTRTFNS